MTALTEWNRYELRGIARQRAVDLFEQEIAYAELEEREAIVPVFAAKVILACAKDGQHRGQGRRRPSDSDMNRIRKLAVEQWMRDRATELQKTGVKRSHAKDKAAVEAQVKFGTGRSAGYIRRKAHTKS
jgi:hypothetical protein